MVDRTGKPVEEMIAEERESSSAQIRTLLSEQWKTIIAEYCEKVSHHELLAAQAEQERRILQGELLRQQQDFLEVHQHDLRKMKDCKNSKILPSMSSPDRSSSRIRRPLWNYLEDYKNCKMKWIVWMILRTSRTLNRCASEIHTLPVTQEYSLNILFLKDYWGLHSYRSDKLMDRQIFGIHPAYQETLLHIHRLPLQLHILKD